MKVTYLVQKRQEDGTTRLETVSHNEWVGLIREKSGLPKAQRRFFIKECIQENGEIDCMYIEVPYEVHKQWNCEHMRSERNRKSSQDIQFFSLEDLVRSTGIELQTAANDLSSHQEDYILDKVLISQLYDAVSKWKPWGADMLTLYLEQKQKKTAQIISRKYHVSMQSVRKYKRQFEKFIKNFLTGVSFSG